MCRVTVIMSTYNGEKYIREQIESILNQKHCDIKLYIRDDGSKDKTVNIIQEYTNDGKILLVQGENVGAKDSFMKAIQEAPEAEYYALADQDDLWDEKKIFSAVRKIKEHEDVEKPVLYHSALNLADKDGKVYAKVGTYNNIGFLNGETRAVTGCTVVFNYKLMELLKLYFPKTYPMHDAWIHNLCLAVNGKVVYDENSYIKYRQHDNNVVGGSKGLMGSIKRRLRYLGKMEKNLSCNMYKEILENYSMYMPKENIDKASRLCMYQQSIFNKLFVLFRGNYFKGRLWWKVEKICLVLLNRY